MEQIYKNPEILIIDDTPEHIHFIASVIRKKSYRVRGVTCSLKALEALNKEIPDLILLDVLMPEMNGFELCSLIRANPLYSSIPIIFLTAVNDSEYIIKGFEAGAQDYVSKPVNVSELLVRIETHLNLKKRTDKLIEAYNDIDGFNHMLSHDLKVSVSSISKLAGFLKDAVETRKEEDITEIINLLTEKAAETGTLIEKYAQLSKLSATAVKSEKVNMDSLVEKTFDEIKKVYPLQRTLFEKSELPVVYGDGVLLEQVMLNIFSNAMKYSSGREKSVIKVKCEKLDFEYVFSIKDNGVGFDMQYAENIFKSFVRLHTGSEFEGTGIGLSIVKKIITLHGGKVWISACIDQGAEISFTLPIKSDSEDLEG